MLPVSKTRVVVFYWLPVLIWMTVIFSASSDKASWQHSSRIIGPLVHWLLPSLSAETNDTIIFTVRKCAHVAEYGILGLLSWRALIGPTNGELRSWSWRIAGYAVAIVLLYAATDEFHQTFVPDRQGSVIDVLLDTSGGAVALGLLWPAGRFLKRW